MQVTSEGGSGNAPEQNAPPTPFDKKKYNKIYRETRLFSISKVLAPLCLTFAFSALSVSAETFMSPNAFRDALLGQFTQMVGNEACAFKLDNAGLKAGLTKEACDYQVYTESAYVRYLSSPKDLQSILETEISRLISIMESGQDDAGMRDRLVVQLRPKSFVSDSKKPLVAHRFAGDMYAVLMLDSPQTLSAVSQADLKDLSLSADDAFQIATKNTRQRMGKVLSDDYGPITRSYSENGLISGQVWLPETCGASASPTAYFVYDYNGVLKTDGENMIGLSKLISYARNMVGNGTSLSGTVVRCSAGQWTQLWPTTQVELRFKSSGSR